MKGFVAVLLAITMIPTAVRACTVPAQTDERLSARSDAVVQGRYQIVSEHNESKEPDILVSRARVEVTSGHALKGRTPRSLIAEAMVRTEGGCVYGWIPGEPSAEGLIYLAKDTSGGWWFVGFRKGD